jgi:hypothetical protein
MNHTGDGGFDMHPLSHLQCSECPVFLAIPLSDICACAECEAYLVCAACLAAARRSHPHPLVLAITLSEPESTIDMEE